MTDSRDVKQLMAADLYCDVPRSGKIGWREHVPGLLVVLCGTLSAGFLADRYGAPLTLMALLIGLSLNFLSTDKRLAPGLAFASRTLLRWGIVLVGVRVTFDQIAALGPVALLALIGIVAAVVGIGIMTARRMGFTASFGLLAGGAVAICGASAALALATVLGERRASQTQLTLVLVGIAAMSAGAMVAYPLVAHLLHFSNVQAGFFLGAAIHDVAQALGAGYSYSAQAGQIAAIVKLTRVAMLAPLLAGIAFFLPREQGRARIGIPWFVIGFFALAGVNSAGFVPALLASGAEKLAAALLAAAVTAAGIQSPLGRLMQAGPKPLVVIIAATLLSMLLSLAVARLAIG